MATSPDSGDGHRSAPRTDWRDSMREAGPYLHLGCGFAGAVVAFVMSGYFVDEWLGTSPLFILLGLVLAFIGIMAQIVKISNR